MLLQQKDMIYKKLRYIGCHPQHQLIGRKGQTPSLKLLPNAALKQGDHRTVLADLQRNVFYHFGCPFPTNRHDNITECLGIEACFAVGEVILAENLASRISVGDHSKLACHFRRKSSTSFSAMPLCSLKSAGRILLSKFRSKFSLHNLSVFP